MRHNVSGRKLNRTASHRKMMFRNMVTDLFRHGRIRTTTTKAKEARSLAERLITYAKAGDLNSRRQAAKRINDPEVLQKLFNEIGPSFADRPGGYTRILKIDGVRKGDNAELSILELVGEGQERVKSKGRSSRYPKRLAAVASAVAAAEPEAKEAPVEETPVDAAPEAEAAAAEEPAAEADPESAAAAEDPDAGDGKDK